MNTAHHYNSDCTIHVYNSATLHRVQRIRLERALSRCAQKTVQMNPKWIHRTRTLVAFNVHGLLCVLHIFFYFILIFWFYSPSVVCVRGGFANIVWCCQTLPDIANTTVRIQIYYIGLLVKHIVITFIYWIYRSHQCACSFVLLNCHATVVPVQSYLFQF